MMPPARSPAVLPARLARRLLVPLESAEQRALFQWAALQLVPHPELRWLFAIPNQGGKGKSARIRSAILAGLGVKPGYPDVGLDCARGGFHGLRIELKRRDPSLSRTSAEQRAWHVQLVSEGYRVELAHGWEDAAAKLLAYLALPRSPR